MVSSFHFLPSIIWILWSFLKAENLRAKELEIYREASSHPTLRELYQQPQVCKLPTFIPQSNPVRFHNIPHIRHSLIQDLRIECLRTHSHTSYLSQRIGTFYCFLHIT
ncbi:hypothetical protein F5Y16DRAFT_386803 [Xylariaceae sp. FL0255]|nr:hypothetical protein F5Y16DRAFT_386803 [Xylariaceae sp. FL0255]